MVTSTRDEYRWHASKQSVGDSFSPKPFGCNSSRNFARNSFIRHSSKTNDLIKSLSMQQFRKTPGWGPRPPKPWRRRGGARMVESRAYVIFLALPSSSSTRHSRVLCVPPAQSVFHEGSEAEGSLVYPDAACPRRWACPAWRACPPWRGRVTHPCFSNSFRMNVCTLLFRKPFRMNVCINKGGGGRGHIVNFGHGAATLAFSSVCATPLHPSPAFSILCAKIRGRGSRYSALKPNCVAAV